MQFLGKQVKSFESSKWEVVESSIMKLKASQLKLVKQITVHQSEFDDSKLYARIELTEGYVDFTIDARCARHLADGDKLDPKSIMVFDLTNGEKTINRLYGEKLD